MSINSIRLSAYGFRMEAVGSKKFIKRERDAFLEFAAGSKRNGTEISRGSMRRTVASILQLRHAWCGFGPGA